MLLFFVFVVIVASVAFDMCVDGVFAFAFVTFELVVDVVFAFAFEFIFQLAMDRAFALPFDFTFELAIARSRASRKPRATAFAEPMICCFARSNCDLLS